MIRWVRSQLEEEDGMRGAESLSLACLVEVESEGVLECIKCERGLSVERGDCCGSEFLALQDAEECQKDYTRMVDDLILRNVWA